MLAREGVKDSYEDGLLVHVRDHLTREVLNQLDLLVHLRHECDKISWRLRGLGDHPGKLCQDHALLRRKCRLEALAKSLPCKEPILLLDVGDHFLGLTGGQDLERPVDVDLVSQHLGVVGLHPLHLPVGVDVAVLGVHLLEELLDAGVDRVHVVLDLLLPHPPILHFIGEWLGH